MQVIIQPDSGALGFYAGDQVSMENFTPVRRIILYNRAVYHRQPHDLCIIRQ
ncbi:hypothetical protein JOJ88_000403 [Pantoea cypripedii]|nr:hypothetical protein [Pantoea cypripedii]